MKDMNTKGELSSSLQQQNIEGGPIDGDNKLDEAGPRVPRLRWVSLQPMWRKLFGKAPLLPGESEDAYWNLYVNLAHARGSRGKFENYIVKEIVDALMLMRRWRGATTAILEAHQHNPQPMPPMVGSDPATKQLPSPDTMLETVPMSPAEAAAILAYCGFDREISTAVSVLQTQKLRDELSARAEAAERTYHRGLGILNILREARAHIAVRRSYVDYVKVRTKHSIYYPRQKPAMPAQHPTDRPPYNPETPLLVDGSGFTELGRAILGPPPVLKGESETAYANLYLAIMNYFGYAEAWDSFLINDVAADTWEMRRLREASETIFCFFFQIKSKQMLANAELPMAELCRTHDKGLNDALQTAGISVGQVSALASGELAPVLSALDDEIARLESRRQRALRALIASRARSVKVSYFNARQVEFRRMHEWKAHELGVEFARKYEHGKTGG